MGSQGRLPGGEVWSWASRVGWREESPGLGLETAGHIRKTSRGHTTLPRGMVGKKEGGRRSQVAEGRERQVQGFALGAVSQGRHANSRTGEWPDAEQGWRPSVNERGRVGAGLTEDDREGGL